ncbi:MAG: diacylglycerol/lipid kinase family protein [Gemmatimonadaceae bacterium]
MSIPKAKHLLFVIHGARAELPAVRRLIDVVRGAGHTVTPRITWSRGDAMNFVLDAARGGVDAVVALGGDGTVNEALNGLSRHDVPLGIIPLGTANDFARQTGIPLDPDAAMALILEEEPTRIDTGELNGRRFLNVSTAGIGAEATAATQAESKEALGALAYAITGARKLVDLQPIRARFTAPGFDLETTFLVLAVGNGRATGGGTLLTPQASMHDGLLDVCIVEARPRREFARLALRFRKGLHVGRTGVHYHQLPSLRAVAVRPITVNLDGEPTTATTLDYHARAGDLRVFIPRPRER